MRAYAVRMLYIPGILAWFGFFNHSGLVTVNYIISLGKVKADTVQALCVM